MSSEGSITSGSQIRQFGLYRTIDARTEEFLRLSRKRQIRQGCACAAASTAITVTVIIVVFFIYEFSLNSDIHLEHTLKNNWLSLMNDTSEDSSFDPKLTKANIDRTTLKLLPLLIKAIKKNAFLEKLLEDHSSSSPSYDKKESSEHFIENIFPRNWFKLRKFPTTKLYAIEYKTSPVVYYRHPTKNIEYYTKIRKIRDYQRVFNYVDKMISEKVYVRSTKPMPKEEIYTENPPVDKCGSANVTHKHRTYHQAITLTPNNDSDLKPIFNCKCPKQLGILLNKILSSIQKLLPESSTGKKLIECEKTKFTQFSQKNSLAPTHKSILNILADKSLKPLVSKTTVPDYFGARTEKSRTFTFKSKPTTDTNDDYLDYIYKPLNVDNSESFATTSKSHIKNFGQNISQQTMQFINYYKNITQRKMLFRNPLSSVPKPIFSGIEYDDTLSTTPSPNRMSTINTNRIYFIKPKYLNDSNVLIKQNNNKNKTSFVYRKSNKALFFPRKLNFNDMNLVDNKITLVKTKQNQTKGSVRKNITNQNITDTNATDKKIYNDVKTLKSQNIKGTVSKQRLLLDNDDSEIVISNGILDKVKPDIIKTENTTERQKIKGHHTLKISHSKDNKTIYRVMNNNNKTSFLSKQFLKNIKPPVIYNVINEPKKSYFRQLKDNSMTIYHLIKDNVRAFNPKKFSGVKDNFSQNKTILRKLKNDNNVKGLKNQLLAQEPQNYKVEQDFGKKINKEIESFTEDIYEFTIQPEIPIDMPEKNYTNFVKEDDYDAAWEDLKTEYIPMHETVISKSKPIYLEFHKNNLKNEDESDNEDPYNIDGNLYDSNL